MRVHELIREAFRNLCSGTSRAVWLAAITAIVASALLVSDAAVVGALQARAQDIRAQAGSVRVLVAEESIDPLACSRLDDLKGVSSSGAVWELDPIQVLALPGLETPVFQVSNGAARVLGLSDARSGGVYLPETLAARWMASDGRRLETSSGPVAVLGTYPYSEQDGRDPRFANAIVVVGTQDALASECWFDVWPLSDRIDAYAYGSVAPVSRDDVAPQIVPLNPSTGRTHGFADEYVDRVTAWNALAVVALFALAAFAGGWSRRIELASNLHVGARRRDVTAGIMIETLCWALTSAATSFAITRLAARILMRDRLPGFELSLAFTLMLSVVAAVLGASIPALLARTDQLFTLFKGRT